MTRKQISKSRSRAPKQVKESIAAKEKRALEIVRLLEHYYRDAKCSLDFKTPFQLLIATILSAQCTDERVNKVTPELFRRFPTAQAMARADLSELEELTRSAGFYKTKSKNIKACSQELVAKYRGDVPRTMEELSALAGVGRKTANVVLGNAYGVPGMVVDTHVMRLSNRMDLATGQDPVKLEQALEKLVPREKWVDFTHWMISHGRAICQARTPKCEVCFLDEICPKKEYAKKR